MMVEHHGPLIMAVLRLISYQDHTTTNNPNISKNILKKNE